MTDSNYSTIVETAENITDFIRVTEDNLAEAGQQRNPDLTAEANARQISEKQQQIRAEAIDWVGRKSAAAKLATTKAEESFKKFRWHLDQKDAAALVRAEQQWNYQVRPLLDAGKPLKEVLQTAGADDLLAIERFAGGWLQAQRMTKGSPLELEPEDLEDAVVNRMGEVYPEDKRDAFHDARKAQRAGQAFQEINQLVAEAVSGKAQAPMSNWGQAKSKVSRLR
jgi:hypothetical protein